MFGGSYVTTRTPTSTPVIGYYASVRDTNLTPQPLPEIASIILKGTNGLDDLTLEARRLYQEQEAAFRATGSPEKPDRKDPDPRRVLQSPRLLHLPQSHLPRWHLLRTVSGPHRRHPSDPHGSHRCGPGPCSPCGPGRGVREGRLRRTSLHRGGLHQSVRGRRERIGHGQPRPQDRRRAPASLGAGGRSLQRSCSGGRIRSNFQEPLQALLLVPRS